MDLSKSKIFVYYMIEFVIQITIALAKNAITLKGAAFANAT